MNGGRVRKDINTNNPIKKRENGTNQPFSRDKLPYNYDVLKRKKKLKLFTWKMFNSLSSQENVKLPMKQFRKKIMGLWERHPFTRVWEILSPAGTQEHQQVSNIFFLEACWHRATVSSIYIYLTLKEQWIKFKVWACMTFSRISVLLGIFWNFTTKIINFVIVTIPYFPVFQERFYPMNYNPVRCSWETLWISSFDSSTTLWRQ